VRIEFQARAPGRRRFRNAHAAAAVLALLAAAFVSGHRLITPGFLLSTNELNFTGVRAGVETAAQHVDLTNPFNADLKLDSVTLRGEVGAYRFPWNGCVGKTIHPKETCQIGVSFVPPVVGTQKATLEVASINGDRRIVALTGLLNPVPVLPVPPASPEVIPPAQTPADTTPVAPDAGTKPVASTTVEPPPPAAGTPPKERPPKATPAPKPTPPPPLQQTPPASQQTPPVSRQTPPPSQQAPPPTQEPPEHRLPVIGASLTPNPVQFPPVTMGALSVRDVMITSTGDAPFPAGQATIQGDHWNDFRIVNDPCSTRQVTSPCTIRVVFLPSEAGQHRAELLLPGGGNQYSVLLDGTATPPPIPIADLQPASIELTQMDFAHPIELRNIGNGNLTVSNISLGGRNPGDFTLDTRNCARAVIGRNQGCTMEVIFQADNARRARRTVSEAVVTLQDNAEGSPRTVVVTGTEASKDPKRVVWRPPVPGFVGRPTPFKPTPTPFKPTPTPAQPPRDNSQTSEPALPTSKPPQQPRVTLPRVPVKPPQTDRPAPAKIQ
jgi:hypothetical protein